MARVEALDKLPALPSIFIMLLFLAVETAPILAKLISPRSEYDFKIDDREMGLKNRLTQNAYQSDLQSKTVSKLNDNVYGSLQEETELINYKKKGVVDILKMQSDYFVDQQKKVLKVKFLNPTLKSDFFISLKILSLTFYLK
jgi:AAA15 family ATPase/GTPase